VPSRPLQPRLRPFDIYRREGAQILRLRVDAVELNDRGEIAIGKRADLIRVHRAGDAAAVRSVWSGGCRVA